MLTKRTSGILLHLTSLPGSHGIGDLGPGAYRFIDFLTASGQSCWQFLPTGPTSSVFDNSPYMCRSVFAGNPLFINMEYLLHDNYLTEADLEDGPDFSEYSVDYPKVTAYKNTLLRKAFQNFMHAGQSPAFAEFCRKHQTWLEDYSLFMCFREIFAGKPWYDWPDSVARRNQKFSSK